MTSRAPRGHINSGMIMVFSLCMAYNIEQIVYLWYIVPGNWYVNIRIPQAMLFFVLGLGPRMYDVGS